MSELYGSDEGVNQILERDSENWGSLDFEMKRFVLEILYHGDAVKAAKLSGIPAAKSRNRSRVLMRDPTVVRLIEACRGAMRQSCTVDAAYVLQKLIDVSNADIMDYVNFDGKSLTYKPFKDLTPAQRAAIKSIKVGKFGIELELHDKRWSLDMIARHIGFFREDNDQVKTISAVQILLPHNKRGELGEITEIEGVGRTGVITAYDDVD